MLVVSGFLLMYLDMGFAVTVGTKGIEGCYWTALDLE